MRSESGFFGVYNLKIERRKLTMEFSENVSEEEAIELHMAGELSRKNPQALLKAVGMLGAESIICEYILKAKESGDFSKVREAMAKVFHDFHSLKSAELSRTLKATKERVEALESKYEPPEDERSWRLVGYVVVFLGGLFSGLMIFASAA